MKNSQGPGEYGFCIRAIKRQKALLDAGAVIAVIISVIMAFPSSIHMGWLNIDWAGIGFIGIVFCVIAIIVLYLFILAVIYRPLNSSLDKECNPQKYLELNSAFELSATSTAQKADMRYTAAYYSGEFEKALELANELIKFGGKYTAIGNFAKARAAFFLDDADMLKACASNFKNASNDSPLLSNQYELLDLLIAISEDDKDGIIEHKSKVFSWFASKATDVQIDYFKGVAEYSLGDLAAAQNKFEDVCKNGEKTVFGKKAAEYLDIIQKQNV